MNLLTRGEELVLLAIWRLQEGAYCVPILKQLKNVTDRNWSIGSVYEALDRLEKKNFVESYLSEPQKKRGGRSKRIYRHTKEGLKELINIKQIHQSAWEDITTPMLEVEYEKRK